MSRATRELDRLRRTEDQLRYNGVQLALREPVQEAQDPWHVVGTSGEPAFLNFWNNYTGFGGGFAPCSFRRDDSRWIHLRGRIYTPAIQIGDRIFRLPILPHVYRPTNLVPLPVRSAIDSIGETSMLYIHADGYVELLAAPTTAIDWLDLDGLKWRYD